jgi:Protein of unknown function (DUF1592)/Protein of unknown function (DUF1588)/Protein of unknown function (DUF1595)/Protein of unknown function (DUF1585)/Protein of unknown function (DUF1587)
VVHPVLTRAALLAALAGVLAPACEGHEPVPPPDNPPPRRDVVVPAPGGLRRLLRRQYVNSVRLLLGENTAQAAMPPEDTSLHGLTSIAAADLSLPPSAAFAYEDSARAVAQAAVRDPEALARVLPCAPSGPNDVGCYRQFVARFGRLAWRRPLLEIEVERIAGIALAAATVYTDAHAGLEYAISALLQSPNFLYLIELGEPDPDTPNHRRLTSYELVSRLSFFLLDQTPDESLLDRASGSALEVDDVRALARQLLRRTEAKTALSAFYAELLRIQHLEEVAKDEQLFPLFTPELARSMQEEVRRLIEDLLWTRDTDARDLLTTDATFVDAQLAALYGVPPPEDGGFSRIPLPPEQQRSGLLSAPALLARLSHAEQTSPTRRGLFVRTTLLCEDVPPPPPDVTMSLPPPSAPTSLKAQLQRHAEDPSCSGCHALLDPIGLALESYDAIGAFRTQDRGFPIDPTADEVVGIGSFASAKELGALLHNDPRVSRCMVKSLLRNALGHLDTPGEQPALDALDESFAASGYRVKALLVELVANPAFLLVGEPR